MSPWLPRLIIATTVAVIALVGITVWLVIDDLQQEKKLQGVKVAAPCRALGIKDPECKRQATLILRACLSTRECRKHFETYLTRDPLKGKPDDPDQKPSQSQPTPGPDSPSGSSGAPSGVGSDGGGSGPSPDPPAGPEPPGGNDPQPPSPPPPEPPPPPGPKPSPPSVGGLGVDVPGVDECHLAPVLCD